MKEIEDIKLKIIIAEQGNLSSMSHNRAYVKALKWVVGLE